MLSKYLFTNEKTKTSLTFLRSWIDTKELDLQRGDIQTKHLNRKNIVVPSLADVCVCVFFWKKKVVIIQTDVTY